MRLPWSSMFQAMALGSMASVLNVRLAVPLNHGDVIRLGEHALELRVLSATTHPVRQVESRSTVSISNPITMALVVGDLINFSTVSEQADHQVLARDIDVLYSELRKLLNAHRGTLVDYVGDAFFAGWGLDVDADAPAKALSYALAAAELVSQIDADLRATKRRRITPPHGVGNNDGVGDHAADAGCGRDGPWRCRQIWRSGCSSIAGHEGRPQILATENVRQAAGESFVYGEPESVTVKGRVTVETIYGVSARCSGPGETVVRR